MSDETVLAARNRFLAYYHLEQTYTEEGFLLHFGRFKVHVWNPGLLPVHDLHHVATGFGSGLIGEAEISAFELRAGWGTPFILVLCLGAMGIGLALSPRRVIRAWKLSRGTRSVYHCGIPYDDLLNMSVRELRALMRVPPDGLTISEWSDKHGE